MLLVTALLQWFFSGFPAQFSSKATILNSNSISMWRMNGPVVGSSQPPTEDFRSCSCPLAHRCLGAVALLRGLSVDPKCNQTLPVE